MSELGKLYQFYNCQILRNSKIYREDLWIRNGKIVDPMNIFYDEKITADQKINCKNTLLSPGFIDLQVNGGFGYDFSNPDVEDPMSSVHSFSELVLRYGVTSFCPTIITSSPCNYDLIIPNIKKRPGGKYAGVLGIHLEGPFINKEKRGAHPVQHIKTLDNGMEDVINVYSTLKNVCLITMAPELDVDGSVIKELVRRGITVSLGHSSGSLSDGERGFSHGASFITHLFNAMLPFHHRDPGLVGLLTSKNLPENKTVFYSIIADGVHTDAASLRMAFCCNPKGLVLVTDGMAAMGLPDGSYQFGEQDVEVSNNRAVIRGTEILSGSISPMDSCVRFLLKSTGCSLVEALECATLHPAQLLGITKSKGTLDFGTDADFAVLDENLNVVATFIAGICVWKREGAREYFI